MPVRLKIYAPTPHRLGTPLRRLLRLLKINSGSWSISLIPDLEMKSLHHRTMGLNSTTDVLTFDLRDQNSNRKSKIKNGGGRKSLDLDTVISLDVARRRARELGHSIRHELLLYCLHSLLHVQGHDDLTPDDARQMHAREDELLQKIGLPPVYHTPTNPPCLRVSVVNEHAPKRGKTTNQKSKIKNQKSKRRAP